jgi:hypothetical protein
MVPHDRLGQLASLVHLYPGRTRQGGVHACCLGVLADELLDGVGTGVVGRIGSGTAVFSATAPFGEPPAELGTGRCVDWDCSVLAAFAGRTSAPSRRVMPSVLSFMMSSVMRSPARAVRARQAWSRRPPPRPEGHWGQTHRNVVGGSWLRVVGNATPCSGWWPLTQPPSCPLRHALLNISGQHQSAAARPATALCSEGACRLMASEGDPPRGTLEVVAPRTVEKRLKWGLGSAAAPPVTCTFVVGEGGLEPPRGCPHWHLKPARLPIPPLALSEEGAA